MANNINMEKNKRRFKVSNEDKEFLIKELTKLIKDYENNEDNSKTYRYEGSDNYDYNVVGELHKKLEDIYCKYKGLEKPIVFMVEKTFITEYLLEFEKREASKKRTTSQLTEDRMKLRAILHNNIKNLYIADEISYQIRLSKNTYTNEVSIVTDNVDKPFDEVTHYVITLVFNDFSINFANTVAELLFLIHSKIMYIRVNMGAIEIYCKTRKLSANVLQTIDKKNTHNTYELV